MSILVHEVKLGLVLTLSSPIYNKISIYYQQMMGTPPHHRIVRVRVLVCAGTRVNGYGCVRMLVCAGV